MNREWLLPVNDGVECGNNVVGAPWVTRTATIERIAKNWPCNFVKAEPGEI